MYLFPQNLAKIYQNNSIKTFCLISSCTQQAISDTLPVTIILLSTYIFCRFCILGFMKPIKDFI